MTPEQDIARMMYRVFQVNPEGIKVFEYLTSRFYDIQSYYRGDPYHTSFLEGQREVLAFIINQLQKAPIQGEEDGEV